jgi:AhpD family alkylhydroperoxidase
MSPLSDEVSITSALPTTEDWKAPTVEPRSSPALRRLFRRRVGLVPTVIPYVSPHGWAYRPFLFLMRPEVLAIERSLCSQICFVVARDNACRFCYGSFRAFLRVTGYSEAELDRLEQELHLRDHSGPDRDALRFAVEISQGRLETGDRLRTLLEDGYSPTAIREVAGIAVVTALVNRVGTMLAVPVNTEAEHLTSQWYFDLLQPVVRSLLRGWQRFGAPAVDPLTAEEVDGPFAPWIRRLRGTCVGHVVHNITTRWTEEQSALSLRTKLLALAVVARGLGAQSLEERARSVLSDRFGLPDDALTTALKHLRGPAVEEPGGGLLRLARASTRYEATSIQRMVPEHTRELSRAETIDTVATLGVCNALARLQALAPLDRGSFVSTSPPPA